jgi:hypothetical protein
MIIKTRDFGKASTKVFVKCDCNNTPEFLVTYRQLKNNVINNCGCKFNYNSELDYHINILKNITDIKLLTIIYKDYAGNKYGIFECHCGNYFYCSLNSIKRCTTIGCGCSTYTRNGYSSNPIYSKYYYMWSQINHRCLFPQSHNFKYYGLKGITICDEWSHLNPNGFSNFITHIGLPPNHIKNPSIERIDNNQGYYPGNCKWIELKDQKFNRSITKYSIEDIKNIRKSRKDDLIPSKDLALLYNTSISSINSILNGRNWNDVI